MLSIPMFVFEITFQLFFIIHWSHHHHQHQYEQCRIYVCFTLWYQVSLGTWYCSGHHCRSGWFLFQSHIIVVWNNACLSPAYQWCTWNRAQHFRDNRLAHLHDRLLVSAPDDRSYTINWVTHVDKVIFQITYFGANISHIY
jgi:hypothetical protein